MPRRGTLGLRTQEPGARNLSKVCKRHIDPHRHCQHEALLLTVLGQQTDAMPDCLQRVGEGYRLSILIDLSPFPPVRSEYGSEHFGSAGPDQSGKADNLAIVQLK